MTLFCLAINERKIIKERRFNLECEQNPEMNIPIFQVDAFSKHIFTGNPAAVCPLKDWLPDTMLQNIAAVNNLAETAFFKKQRKHYEIRWFTPITEVDLCGHATLASAHVLFNYNNHPGSEIHFVSPRSSLLKVFKDGKSLVLDFPKDNYEQIEVTSTILDGFEITPKEGYKGKTDYMFVFDEEEHVATMRPNLLAILFLSFARPCLAPQYGRPALRRVSRRWRISIK